MSDIYQHDTPRIRDAPVSRAALLGAISLFLGGLAGWFGGRMGAVEPTLVGRR